MFSSEDSEKKKMRGYKTKNDDRSISRAESSPKRTEKHSKKTLKVLFSIIIVLCVGGSVIFINNIINNNTEQKDSLSITDEENTEDDSLINGHRYVDLGLSVMWADCNIGSDNPYNHGMLCGWADITGGKGSEDINDYPSANPPLNICGNSSYDIAYSKWGKEWRLPTVREFRELLNKCEWHWIDSNDGKGYKIIGPNGNSIFLPTNYISYNATDTLDYGVYWSGTLCQNQKQGAMYLFFCPVSYHVRGGRRTEKYSFRPVVNDGAEIESIPEEEASEDELI